MDIKTSSFPSVPRLESLHHRLKTAKGPDGQSLSLIDELMVFLEDPPPEVRDRWQAGADWCGAQGVPTSRVSVWRFYRTHAVEWRCEQAPPLGEVSEKSTDTLLKQARHLVALRAVESLHHPHLPARVLVGLVQNENRRHELLLAREKFKDQLEIRRRLEHQQRVAAIDKQVRARCLQSIDPSMRGLVASIADANFAAENTVPLFPVSPHSTS